MSGTGRASDPPPSGVRPGEPTRRLRVVVSGRVQGVGYRASCAARARRAGVGGWVRNRPDGTVEAAFVGGPASVDALVAWCRHGPPLARVDHVAVYDADDEPDPGAGGFLIV